MNLSDDLSMATGTIHFITWNVNGLKEQRNKKFRELHNADVVFLQETHIGEKDNHILECSEDEWHIVFTKFTSSRRGTAILVRKTLDFEYISEDKDTYAGYIVLKCKLQGQLYTLVSIYNHQTDTKTLDKLSRYLQLMATGLLVIGGDFNTVLNPFIDKKCYSNRVTNNRTQSKLLPCVENFMKSLQLVDIWRRKNPVKQNYTFCRGGTSSRLDYFFIAEECLWRVRSCDISDSERPDHQPLSLKINNVSTDTLREHLQIQSLSQLLRDKSHFGIDLSLVQESSHALSEVDIVSAVHSLQVSDTPRPDGIPVSFYKEKIQDIIPYIKVLYDGIYSGKLNCSEKRFNESVRSPHDNSQHFFNVDYLIIATILARRLEDFLESQSEGRIPREPNPVMISSKALSTQTVLCFIEEELERQQHSTSQLFPALSQDFLSVKSLVRSPCLGCPLAPVLISLALKCFASELFKNLEKHAFYVFKQSVIVCVLPEDLHQVHAIVRNSTDEEYDIVILPRGNDEPLQETNLDSESEMEEWDRQMDGAEEQWPKRAAFKM